MLYIKKQWKGTEKVQCKKIFRTEITKEWEGVKEIQWTMKEGYQHFDVCGMETLYPKT